MFTIVEHRSPTQESKAIYDKYSEELIPYLDDYLGGDWRRYRDGHGERLCFDLDYAARFFKDNHKLLEIGALPLFVTLPLMQKYDLTILYHPMHAEVSTKILDRYDIKIKSLRCDLDYETIPAADNSFDGIMMNEVFEHLRVNLIFTMKEVLRVLQPGGTLLLSTPNLRSIKGIYNLLVRGEAYALCGGIYDNYEWLETGTMGHTREYTPIEVTNFLKKIGFEIKGVIYRGHYGGSRRRIITRPVLKIFPKFKPFFSVIASKPASRQSSATADLSE
jgi:SAM-dependent methyltransferase